MLGAYAKMKLKVVILPAVAASALLSASILATIALAAQQDSTPPLLISAKTGESRDPNTSELVQLGLNISIVYGVSTLGVASRSYHRYI